MPVLALLAVSVLFWTNYDRYEPTGPALLDSPELTEGTDLRGEVSENAGRFVLNVPKGGTSARINFRLPPTTDYEYIRVRGRIRVEDVVVGKHPWSCARLLVTQYDANDKWIPGHHGLVAESGSRDWKRHEDEFEIMPTAKRAVVSLHQSGLEGLAEFDGITAQPVRIRASFTGWRLLFVVLWVVAAMVYFPRCRLNRRKLRLLILLNAMAILVGTLMPGHWIGNTADQVKVVWEKSRASAPVNKDLRPATAIATKKTATEKPQMDRFSQIVGNAHRVGHFALFSSLCFLVYLSAALERQHPIYFLKVGFDILLFAVVTESLQFLTLDRTPGWWGLILDIYGMVTALAIFLIVLPLLRRYGGSESG